MIVKDRNPQEHPATDKFTVSGAKAEEQMAFYLRRAFGEPDNKDILVFNDLRLANDKEDDFAQIDHLVIYRRGMVIIESKSVSSEVQINRHGEWSRLWDGQWQGMKSPIHQARLQAEFLKKLLHTHRQNLREKKLLAGQSFGLCPFDVIVAISDKGSIDRQGNDLPEVVKAEAVVDKIKEIMARHRLGFFTPSITSTDGMEKFSDGEMIKLRDFLKRRHRPLIVQTAGRVITPPPAPKPMPATLPPPPAPAARPPVSQPERMAPAKSCRHCQGTALTVEYGRYGYYLKCRGCDGNTRIDFACTACGKEARIRKEKERFHRDCAACGTSSLYHINAVPERSSRQ